MTNSKRITERKRKRKKEKENIIDFGLLGSTDRWKPVIGARIALMIASCSRIGTASLQLEITKS